MQNVTNQTYKLKADSQNKKLSFSYFSNLTLHCLDTKYKTFILLLFKPDSTLLRCKKKSKQTKKHAKHLIHAQSFKMKSKKVVWYSTVKIVNTFVSWISKITIILNKMLQVFMRTSQLHVARGALNTPLVYIFFNFPFSLFHAYSDFAVDLLFL